MENVINKVSKVNKKTKIFKFFKYGINNYANEIVLIRNNFYIIKDNKLSLIKNIRTIRDLYFNCCRYINDIEAINKLKIKYKVIL